MALKTEKRKIGRCTYAVTLLPFGLGRELFLKLAKVAVPSLALVAKSSALGWKSALMNSALAEGIADFITRLDESTLKEFEDAFGAATCVELGGGKAPYLDKELRELHFAGHYTEYVQWMKFCVEFNYADFFGAARSLVADAEPAAQAS